MLDPWMLYRIRYRTTHLVCYFVCYIANVRYRMGSRRIAISYGISYACYIPYEIVLRFISRNRIGYSSHTISHTIFHVYYIVDPVYDVLYVLVCFKSGPTTAPIRFCCAPVRIKCDRCSSHTSVCLLWPRNRVAVVY